MNLMPREPYASRLRELLLAGAAEQDIHDTPGTRPATGERIFVSNAFVERELGRVLVHSRSSVPLLEKYVGRAPSILDVGCSSGGTSIALALSRVLAPDRVVGVDPNARALEAARLRAKAHDLDDARVHFEPIRAGQRLPFPDHQFDLTTCVSVLEFVTDPKAREAFVAELVRVTRPGGHIYLATPTPWRLREYHSGRILGDLIRRRGEPWSSSPGAVRRMFRGCSPVPIRAGVIEVGLSRRFPHCPRFVAAMLSSAVPALRWSKQLFRKA